MNPEEEWKKAKRLCRLSQEDIRMAKELGMGPRGLIKNIPGPTQRWKAPVKVWIRDLYEKKFGIRVQPPPSPAPQPADFPEIQEDELGDLAFAEVLGDYGPPTSAEIAEEEELMTRRRHNFRRAAECVAEALAKFEAVSRIVLFGSVASPLKKEVPRFQKFRRARQSISHECKDVDLAVWVSDLSILNELRQARSRALGVLLEKKGVGIAHHQVEIFLFSPETNDHLGRLCTFGECPKGKPECRVPNCGAQKFLRQVEGFVYRPDALAPGKTITLFERGVTPPAIQVDNPFDLPF